MKNRSFVYSINFSLVDQWECIYLNTSELEYKNGNNVSEYTNKCIFLKSNQFDTHVDKQISRIINNEITHASVVSETYRIVNRFSCGQGMLAMVQ